MDECPNIEEKSGKFIKCSLLDKTIQKSGCTLCQKYWTDGPPTEDNLSPFLIQIRNKQTTPSILTQITNAGKSIINAALSGFETVPPNIKAARLQICEKCPSYEPESGKCRECGCVMSIKASLSAEKCPLNEWSVYQINLDGGGCGCGGQ